MPKTGQMLEPESESEASVSLPKSPMILIADASAKSLLVATLASLLVLPRIAPGSRLDGGLISIAVLALLVGPIFALLPRAARGLRGVLGGPPEQSAGSNNPRSTLLVFLGLAAIGLAALAWVLKAVTHHRGLGGATFGVFGAVVLIGSAVATRRLDAFSAWLRARGVADALIAVLAAPLGLAPVALVLWGIFQGEAAVAAAADILAIAAMVVLAVRSAVPEAVERMLRRIALPVWILLIAAGLFRLETAPAAGAALKASGSLSGSILRGLELWSDRDGDGEGAFFGGQDCDEGDPRRNSRAEEVAGDGIDNNCDGIEGDVERASVAALSRGKQQSSTSGTSGSVKLNAKAVGQGVPSAAAAKSAIAQAPAAPKLAPPVKLAAASAMPASSTSAPARSGHLAQAGTERRSEQAAPSLPPSTRPDLILITLDTVRADHTSIYGYKHNTTPELAKLAARGVVFEQTYAPGSDTQRAIIPLVSGRALSRTPRTKSRWPAVLRETLTVAERLKARGYVTAAVSSFTWLRKDRGFAQGFDRFVESPFRENHPERYSTGERASKEAIKSYRWLKKKKKPLFLWVHLFDAHARYLQHPGLNFGRGEMARYDSEVAFVDRQLGKLVATVSEDQAQLGQTVWLVHGSHGEAFGEHGQQGHGSHLYDEVLRVPMTLVAPGVQPQRYKRQAVSTFDVAPTLLDFAGASREDIEGISLRPIALGHEVQRGPLVAHAWRRSAIVDWPYKLLTYRRGNGRRRRLLFNLEADAAETKDLSEQEPKRLRSLIALHKKLASP